MRWIWSIGALHGLIGSALFFGTLHPLRDVLPPHELNLVQVGAALEIMQGLALLMLSRLTGASIAAALIAGGTTIWTAMLYLIVFTGQHPFDPAVPLGGAVMLFGWIALLLIQPK